MLKKTPDKARLTFHRADELHTARSKPAFQKQGVPKGGHADRWENTIVPRKLSLCGSSVCQLCPTTG